MSPGSTEMSETHPLLYVGPNGDALSVAVERTVFGSVVCAESTAEAVEHLRSGSHRVYAALFDASVGIDDLEAVVAFLNRSFPEVVIALGGRVTEAESNRLRLLGVSLEVDAIPNPSQMEAFSGLAARSRDRRPGSEDWSLKVERRNWVEMSVPSKETYVERVQDLVDMLEKSKLDQDTRDELMLALDELVRNAMEWGNRYSEDRRVTVSYYCAADRIVIRVEDEGEGFDHSGLDDPTRDLKAHTEAREASGKRSGGFGIHLIRNLMDEVLYNEKGNVVMLTKYLDGVSV